MDLIIQFNLKTDLIHTFKSDNRSVSRLKARRKRDERGSEKNGDLLGDNYPEFAFAHWLSLPGGKGARH